VTTARLADAPAPRLAERLLGEAARPAALADDDGALTCAASTVDQLETALRSSEQRYRRLVETTHDGVCLLDGESRIVSVNARLCDMLGYEPSELIGRRSFDVLTRSGAGLPVSPAPRDRHREVALLHKTGREVWALVSATPVPDASGRPASVLAIFTDVTERRLSEESVRVAASQIEQLGVVADAGDAQEAHARLREQARSLVLLRERERIAMDLHDGIIQSLYGVTLSLGALRRQHGQGTRDQAVLGQAIDQLTETIQGIRDYIFQLRTGAPDEADLERGLAEKAAELASALGVLPRLSIAADLDQLGPESVRHLLYIVHEALSNVARHAHATDVAIEVLPWGKGIALTIADNGRGFNPARKRRRPGEGLRNMQERAHLLGANLTVTSGPGAGTTLRVELP
jgi:PAS domain S-box-containing protein